MHLNFAWFRAVDSARFSNFHGTLMSWIVLTDLSKHVKTSCGFVNMDRKPEIARWKVFFQPKLQVFPHSERIWTALLLDPLASDGHLENRCIQSQIGVCGFKNFHQILFFVHNFGYRYARKLFNGSKDADFGLVFKTILSQNNGPMGWGAGSSEGGQKS